LRAAITGVTGAVAGTVLKPAYGANILATRIWPAADYTRVTFELDQALSAQHQLLNDPPRLILDLNSEVASQAIRKLSSQVRNRDPYLGNIEFGHSRPGTTRLILNLKKIVTPELFTLAPIAQYQHRLVLDLHPLVKPDPLVVLLNQQVVEKTAPIATDPIAALIARQSSTKTVKTNLKRSTRRRTPASAIRNKPAPINRRITIAIDAGHGGEDPGALGLHGTYEKNVVLPIAAELRALIRRESGMRAFMTREGDYFVPLEKRIEKAHRVSADLFISIHADAAKRTSANGASVYVLSARGATSAAASWLADQENRADRIGGVKSASHFDGAARQLLLEMSTQRRARDSKRLAANVLDKIGNIASLHKSNVESAGFVVLKTPDIPSILVVTAFLSNPDDEKRLRSPHYQRRMARAIFDGIQDYLGFKTAGKTKRVG
jgi:N-acetylmuramoyl-L-alanine amidase